MAKIPRAAGKKSAVALPEKIHTNGFKRIKRSRFIVSGRFRNFEKLIIPMPKRIIPSDESSLNTSSTSKLGRINVAR